MTTTAETALPRVAVDDPEHASLLALLMAGIVEGNTAKPALAKRLASLRGEVLVESGRMAVTLAFDEAGLQIRTGVTDHPRARVRGSMDALLGMVTSGRVVAPVLAGNVRIGGNPFFLLKLLPLIRVS